MRAVVYKLFKCSNTHTCSFGSFPNSWLTESQSVEKCEHSFQFVYISCKKHPNKIVWLPLRSDMSLDAQIP